MVYAEFAIFFGWISERADSLATALEEAGD